MNKGTLIVYSGPSGVGKGTIIKPLVDEGLFAMSVSATTRLPREGETDGVNYHFLTKDKFENMIEHNLFLEYAKYNQNYYGTPKQFVLDRLNSGIDVILEIEVVGAMQVKKSFPEALFIFVMPPSYDELNRRLTERNTETKEQIEGRLASAKSEISMVGNYDFVIVNEDIDTARKQFTLVAEAGKLLVKMRSDFIEKEVANLC